MSSIATTSLKEILKTQRSKNKTIWQMEAKSVVEHSKCDVNISLPMLGVKAFIGEKNRFSMNYNHKKRVMGGFQHDELIGSRIKEIERVMERLGIEDVPVSSLTILFRDEELKETIKNICQFKHLREDEHSYVAKFVSEPCDGDDDRKKFEKFAVNKHLIKKNGFKYYTLNLKHLINLSQLNTRTYPDRVPIADCNKNRYIDKIANPYMLASKLKDVWGEYGITKHFKKGKEDKLVLVKVS